jgi:hypothetical protein
MRRRSFWINTLHDCAAVASTFLTALTLGKRFSVSAVPSRPARNECTVSRVHLSAIPRIAFAETFRKVLTFRLSFS